jgi:hypothetical protein
MNIFEESSGKAINRGSTQQPTEGNEMFVSNTPASSSAEFKSVAELCHAMRARDRSAFRYEGSSSSSSTFSSSSIRSKSRSNSSISEEEEECRNDANRDTILLMNSYPYSSDIARSELERESADIIDAIDPSLRSYVNYFKLIESVIKFAAYREVLERNAALRCQLAIASEDMSIVQGKNAVLRENVQDLSARLSSETKRRRASETALFVICGFIVCMTVAAGCVLRRNRSTRVTPPVEDGAAEDTCEGSKMISAPEFYAYADDPDADNDEGALLLAYAYGMNTLAMVVSFFVTGERVRLGQI